MKPNPDSIAKVIASPAGFAQAVLGMDLYPKQKAVLEAMAPAGARVSFRSCNEGGKTKRVICAIVLWHLAMFKNGLIVSTSGSFRQIKDQLLPALHTYSNRFPRWDFKRTPRIDTERVNCFWEGISVTDAGKFEGFHQEDESKPLLIVVDEAKTVKNDVFEAIERCKATRVLIASSPGYAEGEFYKSHTTGSRFWQTFKQTAKECPHWKQEDIDKLTQKWGPEHPLVKSMIWAEFMASVEDAVIDLKALEDLIAEPPIERRGERKAFCDFAWTGDGDESVLALRAGNLVTIEEAFRANDLHSVCGRFIRAFNRLGLKPWEIEGDNSGGGKLVIDELHNSGWPIGRADNGSAPRFDEHYANLAAEMWFEGAQQIQRREVILPDDDDLRGQLLDRKRVPHNKGKLAIESKKDMRERNVPSPDRADAVLGAMSPLVNVRSVQVMGHDPMLAQDFLDQQDANRQHELEGAYFG